MDFIVFLISLNCTRNDKHKMIHFIWAAAEAQSQFSPPEVAVGSQQKNPR